MYYIEMLAIWRVSTPSGVVCLDSRAIWRVSTPSGVVCLDSWAICTVSRERGASYIRVLYTFLKHLSWF